MSRIFIQLTILLSLFSCSSWQSNPYSRQDDQYWSLMVKNAEDTRSNIMSIIKSEDPSLYNQIKKDAKDSELLGFWGQSLNIDSGANKQIINDKICTELHAEFGLKTDNRIVHAGVAHTYGYLFSVLDTPYGYKRKRWVLPTLNYAFGLEGKSLSPETTDGALLSNITYFAGTLAFKNDSDRLHLKTLQNVSNEIRNFNYFSLKIEHLEEELEHILLRTTLLKLPQKQTEETNDYLLIYTVLDKNLKKEVLITAFPINSESYKKITAPESLGANRPISVRYNAYLEGLMEKKLSGKRILSLEFR